MSEFNLQMVTFITFNNQENKYQENINCKVIVCGECIIPAAATDYHEEKFVTNKSSENKLSIIYQSQLYSSICRYTNRWSPFESFVLSKPVERLFPTPHSSAEC